MANRLVDRAGMSVADAVVQVQAPWSKGHGPLHMAAAAGKAKSCRILIKEFGLHVDGTGTDGLLLVGRCYFYLSGIPRVRSVSIGRIMF